MSYSLGKYLVIRGYMSSYIVKRPLLQGAPSSLVSDRDSLFTSDFWKKFCSVLRTKLRMSTAFHPQTDGQTEQQNQTLEAYLRNFVSYRQDDWVMRLGPAAFAYNNARHSSHGETPYFVDHLYHPSIPRDIDHDDHVSRDNLAKRLEEAKQVHDQVRKHLQHASELQAKYYNKRHTPMTFLVGDKILLSTRNLSTRRPSKEIDNRYEGPFEIIAAVGKQACTLRLPKKYGRIHPTFHVSLLKPWSERDDEDSQPVAQVVDNDEEPEWEVETILGHRKTDKGVQYLVKWKGFPEYENSWEPPEHLSNAQEAVSEYHEREEVSTPTPKQSRRRRKNNRN